MKTALTIYAAIYVIAASMTVLDDIKSNKSRLETLSDVILLPLGLVGILLYWFALPSPDIKAVWKVAAPVIVIGQIATNLFGRYLTTNRMGKEHHDAVGFTDIVTTLILAPMFLTNLAFAFA
jgi:hypothetical protein